ncbi:hypothetical protein FGO68_gene936 [Halteria grandinella]|uniref:Uncharacterized protein n=1 Tax=Halteria grandinella TaxID=5974 RepID=A0A8J8T2Q0_HALGN|nr:hypothetical protein FGO68_gene936 [Halteria grandinella]
MRTNSKAYVVMRTQHFCLLNDSESCKLYSRVAIMNRHHLYRSHRKARQMNSTLNASICSISVTQFHVTISLSSGAYILTESIMQKASMHARDSVTETIDNRRVGSLN